MGEVERARVERAKRIAKGEALVAMAEERIQARRNIAAQGSLTFRSPEDALAWWGAATMRMGGPQGMHPRTETARDGAQVHVSVDGGRGGDLAEVHATLADIGAALDAFEHLPDPGEAYTGTATGITGRVVVRLLQHLPRKGRPPAVSRSRYRELLVDHVVKGATLEGLAIRLEVSVSTVSAHVGHALRLLEMALDGVVVRG